MLRRRAASLTDVNPAKEAAMKLLFSVLGAVALCAVLAGSAQAATADVKVGNLATPGRLMSATASGAVMMGPEDGSRAQVWVKSGTTPGFSSYRSALDGRCLTARGTLDAPVVRLQACSGSESQQWRTDADGMVYSRAMGLAMETIGFTVGLGERTGAKNQRWIHKLA
jgi:hypothetical protein